MLHLAPIHADTSGSARDSPRSGRFDTVPSKLVCSQGRRLGRPFDRRSAVQPHRLESLGGVVAGAVEDRRHADVTELYFTCDIDLAAPYRGVRAALASPARKRHVEVDSQTLVDASAGEVFRASLVLVRLGDRTRPVDDASLEVASEVHAVPDL